MSGAWEDDGRPADLSPEAEQRFLRRRRDRRAVYCVVSAVVLVVASIAADELNAQDAPHLRAALVLALGFVLGGVINLVIGAVQLVSTVLELRAVRAEIAVLRRSSENS